MRMSHIDHVTVNYPLWSFTPPLGKHHCSHTRQIPWLWHFASERGYGNPFFQRPHEEVSRADLQVGSLRETGALVKRVIILVLCVCVLVPEYGSHGAQWGKETNRRVNTFSMRLHLPSNNADPLRWPKLVIHSGGRNHFSPIPFSWFTPSPFDEQISMYTDTDHKANSSLFSVSCSP